MAKDPEHVTRVPEFNEDGSVRTITLRAATEYEIENGLTEGSRKKFVKKEEAEKKEASRKEKGKKKPFSEKAMRKKMYGKE